MYEIFINAIMRIKYNELLEEHLLKAYLKF